MVSLYYPRRYDGLELVAVQLPKETNKMNLTLNAAWLLQQTIIEPVSVLRTSVLPAPCDQSLLLVALPLV